MDETNKWRQKAWIRGEGQSSRMNDQDVSPNSCWSGCYHRIGPGKIVYTIYPTGDGPCSPKYFSDTDTPGSQAAGASKTSCPGQNTYMSLDDYYRVHG